MSTVSRRSFLGSIAAAPAALADPQKIAPFAIRQTAVASDESTLAETDSGRLRGFRRNGVYSFLGIPYGASTSGERRFLAPEPPESWAGIRNALQYGPVCPNHDHAHTITDSHNLASKDEDQFLLHRGAVASTPGEDCLRLNLWSRGLRDNRKRPVMVWMHGGGYSGGSGHDLLAYNGEALARNHNVVCITHNHRLNVYGYLNLAPFDSGFAESANAGLLDLIAVLRWVRANAASFGGDPECVTIFGQSGGGGKVLSLMAMPQARGLFHRAIVQSGPFLRALTPDYSTRLSELVMRELGIATKDARKLQQVPVDRLSGAAAEALRKMPSSSTHPLQQTFGDTGWGPTVDGHTLPDQICSDAALRISANVPLITGSNQHEFVNGCDRADVHTFTNDQLRAAIDEGFGERTDTILSAYRASYPQAKPFDLYATIAASVARKPAFEQALRKSRLVAAPAYAYIYSWRTPLLDDRPGSFHAAEIAFAFGNGTICDHYSGNTTGGLALSDNMSSAWVAFARTGNPNHPGLPHWPTYDAAKKSVMYLDVPAHVQDHAEAEGLRLTTAP